MDYNIHLSLEISPDTCSSFEVLNDGDISYLFY